jgi:hypothetical protein
MINGLVCSANFVVSSETATFRLGGEFLCSMVLELPLKSSPRLKARF